MQDFLQQLADKPESIQFEDTMAVIDAHFEFTPTAFDNGETKNEAGQNNGSCKIFAFARQQGLSESLTLQCFGHYYRADVLANPAGSDHQNIRQFMIHGWAGIRWHGEPLQLKN